MLYVLCTKLQVLSTVNSKLILWQKKICSSATHSSAVYIAKRPQLYKQVGLCPQQICLSPSHNCLEYLVSITLAMYAVNSKIMIWHKKICSSATHSSAVYMAKRSKLYKQVGHSPQEICLSLFHNCLEYLVSISLAMYAVCHYQPLWSVSRSQWA